MTIKVGHKTYNKASFAFVALLLALLVFTMSPGVNLGLSIGPLLVDAAPPIENEVGCGYSCDSILGDLNANGCLDRDDSNAIFQIYRQGYHAKQMPCADVNQDCKITPEDAEKILVVADRCSDCTPRNYCSGEGANFCNDNLNIKPNCAFCGCPDDLTCNQDGTCS